FLAAAIFIIVAVGAGKLFFNTLGDQRDRIDELQKESAELRDKIKDTQDKSKRLEQLVSGTQNILDKLDEFDNRFLKDQQKGRLLLIDEINKLVRKSGVVVTGAISFRPVQETDSASEKRTRTRRGKNDFVNPYPGLGVSFTIAGPYESFRKF